MNTNIKLGVIGCGKMASAILGGVISKNFLNKQNIIVYDINSNTSATLADKYGLTVSSSIDDLTKKSDVLFLAVKPFKADEVLNEIKPSYKGQLIASILAGVKIEKYLSSLSNAKVVRIMPNTPALVSEGMSAICSSDNTRKEEYDFIKNLMASCGKVIDTTEDKLDIITALSGSGPAYYFKIIDLMAKSAQKLGLSYDKAIMLSAQTALGSAKMLIENNFDTETLIKNVTTPGGCTEVGNEIINSSNIEKIIDDVIEKTAQKACQLGK